MPFLSPNQQRQSSEQKCYGSLSQLICPVSNYGSLHVSAYVKQQQTLLWLAASRAFGCCSFMTWAAAAGATTFMKHAKLTDDLRSAKKKLTSMCSGLSAIHATGKTKITARSYVTRSRRDPRWLPGRKRTARRSLGAWVRSLLTTRDISSAWAAICCHNGVNSNCRDEWKQWKIKAV